MPRVLLHHEGQAIPLPAGDTLIGRALDCRVRFNDPAVSRHHLRLVVREDRVLAQNLSRSNGTLINGVAIVEPVQLRDGDILRIGYRRLRIELASEVRGRKASVPPVITVGQEVEPGSGIMIDDEDAAAEATRPGATPGLDTPGTTSLTQSLADGIQEHTCPRCRTRSSYYEDRCPLCGYVWPPGRPSSTTQEIKSDVVATRAHPRYAVEVPVVYSSESLGIDALVRDVSRGGMFIATDLLDPVGTDCALTALPDGHPAVRFTGVVAHVVHEANEHGRPPGLGIKFSSASPEAAAWLERVLGHFEQAASDLLDGDATLDVMATDDLTMPTTVVDDE
jgi:hypothetical protein